MTDPITPEIFAHLVELAAIELLPEEGEYIRQQLNNQLKAIQELVAIPLEKDLPLALHGVPYTAENTPGLRADEVQSTLNTGKILAQVPETYENYIIVPDIPHTKLE